MFIAFCIMSICTAVIAYAGGGSYGGGRYKKVVKVRTGAGDLKASKILTGIGTLKAPKV